MLDDVEGLCARILVQSITYLDYPARAYEVSVLLTDDARQQALNAEYRGKDAPTNVLSFPATEALDGAFPSALALPLGDISLALETVRRESDGEGLSFADHFCHLLVHGMLHLAGYDHEIDHDAEEMEALEVEILAGFGIENPYADKRPGVA
ncbi:MAG: rRNA maturation RNase YbeY [Rhodospirillales bacterium]|nr:rRNA maturation RNase YbeY [Rhodospirillales bacterium]MBO6787553.1 rRNA maturation RNase YbeY [Rhodospirillales bacterium]